MTWGGTSSRLISPGSRGLTPTFSASGVDLQLWAHEHSYERLWPIYNYQVRLREGRGPMWLVAVDPRTPQGVAWCDVPLPLAPFSRYLMAAERCRTPTLEALSTSSPDLL